MLPVSSRMPTKAGLGNQFLDHLRQADAILHIVDASGSTDTEGNPVETGSHDPDVDIAFLTFEMTMWVYGILEKHWAKLHRQAQSKTYSIHRGVAETFTGLGITPEDVRDAEVAAGTDLMHASGEDLVKFSEQIVRISKPMIVIGNKADQAPEILLDKLKARGLLFATAAGELALRNAAQAGLITYEPGDPSFLVRKGEALNSAQQAGLQKIAGVMKRFNGTGVQQGINHAIFTLLDQIVVYPVEDEHRFADKHGKVLPDAFLMKKGSTPKEMAFMVHTDIGKGFLYAVDARTKMRVKDNHQLKDGDIIRIVSTAK